MELCSEFKNIEEDVENSNCSPVVIMRFSKETSPLAIAWLQKMIVSSQCDGGCGLNVEQKDDGGVVLFLISATAERIRNGADEIGIRKVYKDGSLRDFSVFDRNNFKDYQEGHFFLNCEQQRIITQSLEGLRANEEKFVPGHESVFLYQGKSIVHRMLSKGLMVDFFPLHDLGELDSLKVEMLEWKFYHLPLRRIQSYYGDSVAVYFAFLNYYERALVWLVLLGLLHWLLVGMWDDNSFANSVDDNWMVSLMHLAWAVYLLEGWRHKSMECAFEWGSLGMKTVEKPRMAFRGKMGRNPVTEEMEPQYPSWKRNLRIYLVSTPIVFLCCGFAVACMFYYFSWEIHMMAVYQSDSSYEALLMTTLPSVVYSILIQIANFLYQQLAESLTHHENHKYEKSYHNYLILKILSFNFVNNFLVLFYIAFVYRDMAMLRTTLRNLFLTDIAISQLMECVLPFVNFRMRTYGEGGDKRRGQGKAKSEATVVEQARIETMKDTYQSTFEDYLELWLQFGYVMLFACAYPPAAFFAIINNFIEQRTDSFKLCNFYRRPFARQTDGIDAWQAAFEFLVYISIISNLALIFFSPRFFVNFYEMFPDGTIVHVIFLFVVVEHLLLLCRFLLSYLTPSVPAKIRLEMNKYRYRSRQLLKKENFLCSRQKDEEATNKQDVSASDEESTLRKRHADS